MKVAIIGMGYVGLSLAREASHAGNIVLGIESNSMRVAELLGKVNFEISTDYSIVRECDIAIIAVPTPLSENREPDLSYLKRACTSLKENLKRGALVINESTSYPGTLRNLVSPLMGDQFEYAVAPERIDPGNEEWNIRNTPRVLSGLSERATNQALDFYEKICENITVVSTPEVAEAAKLFENTFRHVNIALVNEFSQVTDALGISSIETLNAAATKPFGFMSFLPSVGVGGHCIPVDPSYLAMAAKNVGFTPSFIELASRINSEMPFYVARKIRDIFGGVIKGKKIQIAGISYKANVSDTRESPAIALLKVLRNLGAEVTWHDDLVREWNGEMSSNLAPVDLGVIATRHRSADFGIWRDSSTKVIDVSFGPENEWKKFL